MENPTAGQQNPKDSLKQNNVQAAPQINIGQNNFKPDLSHPRKFPAKIIFIILAVILAALVIGGAYAYIMKIGPFAVAPYTQENLLSGILSSVSRIKSSSYSASISLSMGKRDAGARPFVTKLTNADELAKQYKNDSTRASDVSSLLDGLTFYKQRAGYPASGNYPASLQALLNDKTNFYVYRKPSIKDPLTGEQYNYETTDNGRNFKLTVTFETADAVSAIKRGYNFSADKTIINGKIVTFTKDSYQYFYFSPTPPKPFLVSMADALAYIPPETKVSASVSAQAYWASKDSADWKFNVDATGDFGDLTYKVDADALKKADIYYLKINNIPGMILSYLPFTKGQWIRIDPSKASSYNSFGDFTSGFPDAEKYYKEHRAELTSLLEKIVTIANDKKLISLKHPAYAENVDGSQLYRYDLEINKDAILPFYESLQAEVSKTNLKNNYPMIIDSGYVEYLKSPEFSEAFDYYQKNTMLTLWADSRGYPAIVSYNIRIVPPDSAQKLKDKQANLTFKLKLSDINSPVNIAAPSDYKNLEDILKSDPNVQKGKDAVIKGNMSLLMTDAAVYYDTNYNFNNWCSNEKYYIPIKKSIDDAYGTGSKVTCICDTIGCKSAKKWCASALLSSSGYYCVDSSGIKTQSTSSSVCYGGSCNSNKN